MEFLLYLLEVTSMDKEHGHCLSCVDLKCMERPQRGISCKLTGCPQACGAVFHQCKTEEHQLLCPLLKVPCLNSAYGCPSSLARHQMSAHLKVCPAGVVCCTMVWNRWPVNCTDSPYECLRRGVEESEQLDFALGLQDQRTLLESLRFLSITPTLQRVVPESPVGVRWRLGVEQERLAKDVQGLNEQNYVKLFKATMEAARSLASALELVSSANSSDKAEGVRAEAAKLASRLDRLAERQNGRTADEATKETSSLTNGCVEMVAQEDLVASVSDLVSDANVADSQAHGAQQQASGGNADETVGEETSLPINGCVEVVAQEDFVALRDQGPLLQENHKTEDKAVDTSDMEQDDDPMRLGEINLTMAALVFSVKESREHRSISDRLLADGGRVHSSTQTFPFPAAVLVTNSMAGVVGSTSASIHASPRISCPSPYHTLSLRQVLESLKDTACPGYCYIPECDCHQHMFPFACAQSFRRDEFSSHLGNVHGDIYDGLNGWMEQRCPLAFYGCTFSQRRFYPTSPGSKVIHSRLLRSFGVQPHPGTKLSTDSQSDMLSGLPAEILSLIAGFLDSFSLCQLSLVSRTMRQVCAGFLQSRGIVELQWERRQCSGDHRTVSWQVKHKVWRFSTAFSPVRTWGFTDVPSMSNHLKKCPYNTVVRRTEPVPLPPLGIRMPRSKNIDVPKYLKKSKHYT